ncbi:MAG: LLM class flavin-dependent oxidoreductase [Alphaproteobacteria bacterium]|nr:LLM class flavin-dependent oxidoreductase [Alphaproteobacteria bacterium]MDP6874149.1 LLM class flavin-dependent oxidoreductase [Alphaproteobacteria bacterium]
MKFGVLQFFSWPGRRVPLATVYDRAFQRMEIMDKTGYDAVWLAEHHFSTYSVCPSVHMMGTHIAARTEKLRIGMAVSLASFYHPLRLAEEVALLDNLSGGRVNWGAGRGFDPTEHKVFGVEPKESYPRFREAVEIVLKAWNNDKVNHTGEFWHFKDVEVLPKPFQDPMPVWLAASSLEALEWSASEGHSIMMDPHATHAEISKKRSFYKETLEGAGFSIAGRDIPMARTLAMGATEAEARKVGQQGAEFMFGSYLRKKANIRGTAAGAQKTVQVEALDQSLRDDDDPVARYVNEIAICGTPEKVIDDIQEMQETLPLEYLMIAPLSHASFVMFTEKVLPRFL